ncbi:serine O-acetyltransferase EpsC [Salinicola lusitanus]|uniref:Serine acetyltransferase n=1 Tax=Salinicola lusitanus TaxID=1949085 RepID=A0ABZ3CNN7_9GAMM
MKPRFDTEQTGPADTGHRPIPFSNPIDTDALWQTLLEAAKSAMNRDTLLSALYRHALLEVPDFASALARVIAETLTTPQLPEEAARKRVEALLDRHPAIARAAERDLVALLREDAAIPEPFTPLLFFPGYRAVQCHRIAHQWWLDGLTDLASHLQYRTAVQFSADIHPAATLGAGLFVDHGAGIVIGETAVVEDDVTIFHGVTLGSSGKVSGDRHPKVRRGAFLGAGATILGNIEIGEDARIGAAAIVTRSVAAGTTVIGTAARPR